MMKMYEDILDMVESETPMIKKEVYFQVLIHDGETSFLCDVEVFQEIRRMASYVENMTEIYLQYH